MRHWIRIMKFAGGLVVASDGVFPDKESCQQCGHICYEMSEELAQSVNPNDIKGRIPERIENGKIAELSEGKSAVDLD